MAWKLQHVDSFDDQNIRLIDHVELVRNDVINLVRINGCFGNDAVFHVVDEFNQTRHVIAFRKAFPAHDALLFQDSIREDETVSRNQLNLFVRIDLGQKRFEQTRRRALANGNWARNP